MKMCFAGPLGLVPLMAGTFVLSAGAVSADFWGSTINGEWRYMTEELDSFEAEVIGDPEYVYRYPGMPFDGYYIDFIDDTVTFKFSTWSNEYLYFLEGDFNGWTFLDQSGDLNPLGSIEIVDSSGSVDWSAVTAGIVDESQFFVNFGTLGADQHIHNGDFVTFEISFIPAPATALVLMGAFHRRRRR